MRLLAFRALSVALIALALSACALTRAVGLGPDLPPDAVAKGAPPDVAYAKGQRLFAAEQWKDAADAFGKVWRDHPQSELAADAQFYEAESRYGQGKWNGAFELYKAYVKDHPLSPHAPLIQRRLYDVGKYQVEAGSEGFLGIFDYSDQGVDILDYLVGAFPHGDLADDALIYMADFEWRDARPYDAIRHLHDLIDNYPTSEWALEARLRLAKAYRDVNRGTRYDADSLRRSVAQYKAYIELVTSDAARASEYAALLADARAELALVEESLAEKGLIAADYYLKTGRADTARAELRNVVREFPRTQAAAEARRRLGLGEGEVPPEEPRPMDKGQDGKGGRS